MRSRSVMKLGSVFLCAALLSGCLYSEEPILDARNARALPIKSGEYVACPIGDEENVEGEDCERFSVSTDKKHGVVFYNYDDEEESLVRFRRVAYGAYVVQIAEDGDGYMYYYGKKDGEDFLLSLMFCEFLPASLREELIADGDMESEPDQYGTCQVNTRRAIVEAAKAYHRGVEDNGDAVSLLISPAPPIEDAGQSKQPQ